MTLKRVNASKASGVSGIIGVVVGFVLAVVYSLNSLMAGPTSEGFAVVDAVLIWVQCAAAMCVLGGLFARLYNVVANWIGGVPIELETE